MHLKCHSLCKSDNNFFVLLHSHKVFPSYIYRSTYWASCIFFENIMHFVFAQLKFTNHCFDNTSSLDRYLFIISNEIVGSAIFSRMEISAANKNMSDSTSLIISSKPIQISSRPRIDPFGKPANSHDHSENSPFITTLWNLSISLRYDSN